jgi:hypothetical protein
MVNGTVRPFLAPGIPGLVVIVPAPIFINREWLYCNTEARCVGVERNIIAVILIREDRGEQPPAGAIDGHIAPTPIIETPHYLDGSVGVELRHDRVGIVGACVQIRRFGCHRVLRRCRGGKHQQNRAEPEARSGCGSHG